MEPKPAVARRGKQKAPIKSVIGPNGEYLLSKEQRQIRNMKRKLLRAQAKVARLKEKQEKEALQAAEDAKTKKRSKKADATNTDEDVTPAPKKRKTAAKKTPPNAESLNGAVETPVVASSSSTKKTSKKNSEQTPLAALLAQALEPPPAGSAANAASSSASSSSNDAAMSSSSNSAARTNNTSNTNITKTIYNTNNISTTNNTAQTDSHSSIDAIRRFEEHLTESATLNDFARKQFFKHARCFKFTGSKGDYILWAYRKSGEMSAAGYAWPSAFVHDHTSTVHAAMWYVGKKNTFSLVSIWAYSPTEDERNNYYLKAHQKDVATFRAKCNSSDSPITDSVCREHFVSSGVYCVPDFHCAALCGISATEMQQFAIVVDCR